MLAENGRHGSQVLRGDHQALKTLKQEQKGSLPESTWLTYSSLELDWRPCQEGRAGAATHRAGLRVAAAWKSGLLSNDDAEQAGAIGEGAGGKPRCRDERSSAGQQGPDPGPEQGS